MDKVSARQSKLKRLKENVKQENVSPRSLPQMSETAMKRWCEARDTYLGDRPPPVTSPRRLKQKPKPGTISVVSHRSNQSSHIEFQTRRVEQEQQPSTILETIDEPIDTKCVGTETEDSIICNPEIEHIDEAIQADLPSPQIESPPDNDPTMTEKDELKIEELPLDYEVPVQYDDKATETDLIVETKQDDQIDRAISNEVERPSFVQMDRPNLIEIERSNSNEITVEPMPDEDNHIEPVTNDDDTKSILSLHKSEISLQQQIRRLRHRFKRVSKERRLLIYLLIIYLLIMFGLLVVIFLLLWAFQERSLIIEREVNIINTEIINGVARYGESCQSDNDCRRPFTCFRTKSSTSGTCRCPIRYDFINDQCIGDLNALCTKDTNCQRYMICSGMYDGTRRCQCQTLYIYDNDRRQCRGDYEAPCRMNSDCRANMICNTTIHPSLCSCALNYRYYPLVQKCRGDPGALCEQATAECVDNAECRDGACECAFQFIPNEKKICIDPCPKPALNRVKIRYPGHCRRFIDCKKRTKNECPEMTIFNFRTQLCDYRKNVLDC